MDHLADPGGALAATALSEDADSNAIVARGRQCFVRLNQVSSQRGDFAIVPYREVRKFEDLTDDESLEVFEMARRSASAWRATFGLLDLAVSLTIKDGLTERGCEGLKVRLTLDAADNTNLLSRDVSAVSAEPPDSSKIRAEFSRRFIEADLHPS